MLASIFATLVANLMTKPRYRAAGKIELTTQSPRVTKFEDMAIPGVQLRIHEFMQTQLNLLQSDTLAGRVIDKLQLHHNPVFSPQPKHGTEKDSELHELKIRKMTQDRFLRSLEVKPERDTTIFSLAFSSIDPTLSRDVINVLIEEFIAWQVDKKIDATIVAKQRLEKQIELARDQLEKAERKLNDFSRKTGIVSLDANLNLAYSQLQEVNKAYSAVEAERVNKKAIYKQSLQGGPTPTMIDSALMQKLRADYITADAEYKESSATFKDDYPKLQSLKAKVVDLEKQIKAEENRILEAIKNDYLTAATKEESVKKETEEKKRLAIALNEQSVQFRILAHEVETSKQIHQSLLERVKEIDAKVGTELGNIQVVDYAKLPLDPYSPKIPRNLLLAALAGALLGLGTVLVLGYLDNTVKRADELSGRFQLPVLGVLPMVQPEDNLRIENLVRLNPAADFSESIRVVKVSIQLSSTFDRPSKLLLITSIAAGEGKSTVALNLALAFASEEKVLLIDADLRKPRLHKILGTNGNASLIDGDVGLSNYLTTKETCIVQKSGMPNLSVVFAGPAPLNASELLSSKRMRSFLAKVCKQYDRIIIDGPPSLGFADALILGHYADGVILVSTLGQTDREALRTFRGNLENVGGHMIGTIVTQARHELTDLDFWWKKVKKVLYEDRRGRVEDSGDHLVH